MLEAYCIPEVVAPIACLRLVANDLMLEFLLGMTLFALIGSSFLLGYVLIGGVLAAAFFDALEAFALTPFG